jgi:hypothetical protein
MEPRRAGVGRFFFREG